MLETSKFIRQKEVANKLLQKTVGDYEKVVQLQAPVFNKIGTHARGELLMGIALSWNRLGKQQKAFACLERITKDLSGSDYAKRHKVDSKRKLRQQLAPALAVRQVERAK